MASLHARFAAAYDRSWRVRLATVVGVLLVHWAGMAMILLFAPMGVQPVAWLVWVLVVACGAAWAVVGPAQYQGSPAR